MGIVRWCVGPGTFAALFFSAAVLAHDPVGTKVTWEREIAPIMQARCASCHSKAGRAQIALTTYEEARPWARAIREEVLARRMPKWHVVRGYGDFANDPSLSSFEIALIVSWVDGGAPRRLPNTPATKFNAPRTTSPAGAGEANTRSLTLPCTANALPAGRLLAVKPMLEEGGSLKVEVTQRDGLVQPLLWVTQFDPKFPETYWLRNPLDVDPRTAMRASPGDRCSMQLIYERAQR